MFIEAQLGQTAANLGLQVADGDILFTLRRADGSLSPSKLSDSLLVSTGTMTGRLDRLEKKGFVRRIPHPKDRRSLEIELTPEGLKLVDDVIGDHVAREHELLSVLTATERDQLVRITRKLLAALSA